MANVYRNTTSFWGTYTSGMFNAFYATEAEAIKHCDNPENGAEFNGQWFQDRYMTFHPQSVVRVDSCVYSSGTNEAIAHYEAVPCEWELAE